MFELIALTRQALPHPPARPAQLIVEMEEEAVTGRLAEPTVDEGG
jgi:hypothetical protein